MRKTVKNTPLIFSLFIFSPNAFANPTCVTPEASTVIYFGNGINTDRGSARNSLSLLKKELTGIAAIKK
jgi:hypothetical protein